MVRRARRVGQWVLPVTAIFLSLSVIWTILAVVTLATPEGTPARIYLVKGVWGVGALVLLGACATLAGIAFVVLATLHHRLQSAETGPIEQLLRRQNQLLEQMNEGLMLSDRAKAVAFREKERDALRGAIQEELAREDWEAAYHLIDQMRRGFGYHAEAERLRQEVDQRRRETVLAKMSSEMPRFRELLRAHDWDGARAEAKALMDRYPDEDELNQLLVQVDEAREAYKRGLLSELRQAIERSEFDRGVELLKVLDQYLTPGEAAGLREAARDVFRAKLHNLGVQFSMAVSERNWAEALRIGQQIIEEFPNSRMAEEVHDNLDALRQRAAEMSAGASP